MVTETDIKNGMGLDEIIGSDAPETVFGSLKSDAMNKLEQSLNPRVPGGVTELLDMFVHTPSTDQGIVADAICALLEQMKGDLDNTIQSDLTAQTAVKDEQEAIDLTSQILPTEVLQPNLLNLVTTPAFKAAIESEKNTE